jgi:hypothetical protein
MFSSFAGVCFAIKSKSIVKCLLLTGKTLSKIRKTVYGKISRKPFSKMCSLSPPPPFLLSLSLSCTTPFPPPPPRHVFIISGSSGIGLALAHQAALDDPHISILAWSISKLEEAKQAICLSTWIDVAMFAADVRDYEAVSKAINEAEPIRVLIVNQGVFGLVFDEFGFRFFFFYQIYGLGLIFASFGLLVMGVGVPVGCW